MGDLKLGSGLVLPSSAATVAGVITGQRGTGKTSTAVVFVEEARAAGYPSAIIDPTGVWSGLRYGSHALDHVLFGGFRGAEADLPLRAQDGAEMGRLIAEERMSAVLGLRHMRKGEQVRFVCEFAEELYHLNRTPLVVVVDEAHRFAPQQLRDSERGGYGARCLGALIDIVTLGRAGGLGIQLITQRLARLHKDCVESCEMIVAHRLMGPNDKKQIAGWLEEVGDDDQQEAAKALVTRIRKLPLGQAVVYAPTMDVLGEFKIRKKRTFDSSAAPDGPGVAAEPKGRAEVDLAAVGERLAAAVEEAKANDPKALRARVAELERQLTERPAGEPERVEVEVPVKVEVPYVPDKLVSAAHILAEEVGNLRDGRVDSLVADLDACIVKARALSNDMGAALAAGPTRPIGTVDAVARSAPQRPAAARSAPAARPRVAEPGRRTAGSGEGAGLPKAERSILTVLAQHPDGRTKRQLAMQTGYAGGGGGFNNALGKLRGAEPEAYIAGGNGDVMLATAAGLDALGEWEPLPAGRALLEHWKGRFGKAERMVLDYVFEHGESPKDVLAAACGYAESGGGFNNALGRLRTLELLEKGTPVRFTAEFAQAVGL